MGVTLKILLARRRVAAMLVLAIGLISMGALAPSVSIGSVSVSVSPLTDPAKIEKLAKDAYTWGVAPEFVYRFANYNELVTAPVNTFGGAGAAAAWNNQGTNAGNATVLYLNAMLNLSGKGRGGTKELVLTVPPSHTNYYVIVLLDAFIKDVGSIGTRTTPSRRAQTYLLVGPTSRYAHDRIARIHGFTYRVMAFDTNRGWLLTRIRADSLAPAANRTSVASILKNVVERFGLSTLAEFEARGHRPKYFKSGQYTPTQEQIKRAKKWHTAPTKAVAFFKQVGEAVRLNPLPTARTGLNGIPLRTLPSWVIPQAGAAQALPQSVLRSKRHAGPVPAARSHGERLQGPAQLGPSADQRPPGWHGRRESEHRRHSGLDAGDSGHQLLGLRQQRDRDVPQHAPGVSPPSRVRGLRRGHHPARQRLRRAQQPRRHVGHHSSTATTPTS